MRSKLKFLTQSLVVFQLVLFIHTYFPIQVYADTNLGGEGNGSDGTIVDDLFISHENSGYRIYLEDSGGSVVSDVIDLYFGNTPPSTSNMHEYRTTSIGNATVSHDLQYSEIEWLLPNLVRPIAWGQAQGDYIKLWFEQKNPNQSERTNADVFLEYVYKAAGIDDATVSTYLENYHRGNYRIVVEGIYWYGYVRSNKTTQIAQDDPNSDDPKDVIIVNQDTQVKEAYPSAYNRMWVYGTIKEIAKYEQSELATNETHRKDLGMDKIDPENFDSGTYWLFGRQNGLLASALCLKDPDEFSGLGGISSPKGKMGSYSYTQIQNPGESYGIHVILKEQASEKWATWNVGLVVEGGPVGKSPGVTPKMPPLAGMENVTTTWRDVTVIKYYEEYSTDKETGTVTYNTVQGPYKTKSICLQIAIQFEPGWTLKEWHKAYDDPNEALYQDIKIKYQVGKGEKTVTMEPSDNDGLDTLVIWHVRKADDPPPPPTTPPPSTGTADTVGVMELSESEITQSYFTNKVVGNTNPQLKFSWSNPHIASGEMCYAGAQHNFNWQDSGLTLKVKLDNSKFNLYKTILGTQNGFSPRLYTEDNQHMASVDSTGASEYNLNTFKAKFTIWRGKDQPTIAKYIASPGDSQLVDTLLDKTIASNKYQESSARKTSNGLSDAMTEYKENLQIHFNVDSNGDYIISTTCQNGSSRCSRGGSDTVDVLKDNKNNNYQFKGQVTVQFYNGEPNTPQTTIKELPSLAKPQSIMRRQPAYDNAKYNPYVQMSYQTTEQANTADGNIVYVLGSYEREFSAQAALKLSWKESYYSGTKYSMLVRSDQWQTHATALQKYGKNILLPGGAIYQVTTNPGSSGTLGGTLTLEAWYPDIVTEYKDGMIATPIDKSSNQTKANWDGNNGANEFEKLVEDSKNSIFNNARLRLKVINDKQQNAWNGTYIQSGTNLKPIGHNGLKAWTDSKYKLDNDSVSAQNTWRADVQRSGVQKTEIQVIAKPDGKVEIGGNGGTLSKTQNADAIPSTQAANTADDYTSLMTNFIGQLQRNSGNDKTTTFGNYWAKEDGHWYNEAFGFKVNYYKATIKVDIPKNDGNGASGGVTAVLDPNLGPTYTGTATKFNSVNTGQFFMVLNDTALGRFGDDTVHFPVPQSGYILSSQPFYIAPFTVQDND